jgi:hypothetical protein
LIAASKIKIAPFLRGLFYFLDVIPDTITPLEYPDAACGSG